jgi:hypothetical protein
MTQEEVDGVSYYNVDTTRAEKILGIKFRSFEETFLDMAKAFLEMEASSRA